MAILAKFPHEVITKFLPRTLSLSALALPLGCHPAQGPLTCECDSTKEVLPVWRSEDTVSEADLEVFWTLVRPRTVAILGGAWLYEEEEAC